MKKILLTLAGLLLGSNAAFAQAGIRLNEVHLNPPNSDDNFEFIELKSISDGVEPCTGLTLVIINNVKDDGAVLPEVPESLGVIKEAWNLNDLSTGTNGLLLLGNGYLKEPRGGPWAGFVDPATAVGDPAGMGDSDIKSNDGLSILLVSGFTGAKDQDLDLNNDGVLDSTPWTTVIDSIGTRDRDGSVNPYVVSGANIGAVWTALNSTLGARDPDTFARKLGSNAVNSAASWYGGKLHGSTSTTITYETGRIFGPGVPPMLGEVTPGRANLSATLGTTSFRINEVGLDPVGDNGSNDRFQYIEIINTGTSPNFTPGPRSLNGYWLVLVDSNDSGSPGVPDPSGVGNVIEKWDLSSFSTGNNGLLLIGSDFSASYNAFLDLASPQTGFGKPEAHNAIPADLQNGIPAVPAATGMGEGDIGFKKGFSLFLVQNPTSFPVDIDTNDDGVADVTLATNIVDQVGFSQVGKAAAGRTYSSVDLRSAAGGMNAAMNPSNFGRKPRTGVSPPVAAGEWYGGIYPGGSPGFNLGYDLQKAVPEGGGTAYDPFFGGFRGAGTPGLPNLSAGINAANPPVAASIRINEVMINPTNNAQDKDGTREYIELASTNGGIAYMDNLWVIVVDLEGSIGTVTQSFPLDGQVTGLNGIALIGDNYDSGDSYPYRVTDGELTPFCNGLDPVTAIGGDDLPNDGSCIMILRNPKTSGAGARLTLSADGLRLSGNLHTQNGVLVPPSDVAEEVVDSIAVSPVNPGTGYGWISNNPTKWHHVARFPGNFTPNNGASYYAGQISQAAAADPSLDYTNVFLGPFKGAGSPGRPNHGAPTGPVTVGSLLINELNFDPPGADLNFEFVELLDAGGKRRSLNGYYLVMLDNVAANTGSIRHYWSLDGMFTGDNGLFLLGNRYPLGGTNNPWSTIMEAQTQVGDPVGREGLSTSLSDGSLGDETDNLNLCLVLVRGFNRHLGFDMDQLIGGEGQVPPVVESGGDGIFDKTAWLGGNATAVSSGGVHDSVMFRDFLAPLPPADQSVGYPWDGFAYPGFADLGAKYLQPPAVYYHPDTIARFAGELSPNSAAAWYGGDINGGPTGNTGSSTAYVTGDPTHPPFPAGFTGSVTPGKANLSRSTTPDPNGDPDGDGASNFLEQAFGSNPAVADSPLPVVGTVNVGGANLGAITYRRLKGGATSAADVYTGGGFTYTVQTSTDLQTWVSDGSTIEPAGTANVDATTETATFRLITPVRAYMRLRVTKP